MKECTKAMRRRLTEHAEGGFPWRDIFKGDMIDIGSGDDPLGQALSLDLPDGHGDDLRRFFGENRFDLIHGSQVLEHAIRPEVMMQSWIECLRPGGYIVATVPDFKLYEKETWPSKWNKGHRTCWTMDVGFLGRNDDLRLLPSWLEYFPDVELILCRLVDTNYDYSPSRSDIDQTYDPDLGVECFIEFLVKKK